jgi:hypothetical protein
LEKTAQFVDASQRVRGRLTFSRVYGMLRAMKDLSVITDEDRIEWINAQPAATLKDPRFNHICTGPMFRAICRDEIDEEITRQRGGHRGYESIGGFAFKVCFCAHRHDHVIPG